MATVSLTRSCAPPHRVPPCVHVNSASPAGPLHCKARRQPTKRKTPACTGHGKKKRPLFRSHTGMTGMPNYCDALCLSLWQIVESTTDVIVESYNRWVAKRFSVMPLAARDSPACCFQQPTALAPAPLSPYTRPLRPFFHSLQPPMAHEQERTPGWATEAGLQQHDKHLQRFSAVCPAVCCLQIYVRNARHQHAHARAGLAATPATPKSARRCCALAKPLRQGTGRCMARAMRPSPQPTGHRRTSPSRPPRATAAAYPPKLLLTTLDAAAHECTHAAVRP